MSGGVDSSVTAALLKERGFDVVGIHMKMWSDPNIACTDKEDRYDAMRVAAKLGIPFQTWDFTNDYKKAVVDYMIREYATGRTPNPDVMCNRHIKFGRFLERALREGADYIATGHYAKIENQDSGAKIQEATDKNKDQTYFLWTLTPDQLRHCLFPIGEYTKPEVRKIAERLGLPTAAKPDSQGVCFIGEFDMREFLQRHIPAHAGKALTATGKVVGEHDGVEFYTVGQRHGISFGGGIPYYVAEKHSETNTITVAEGPYDEKLFRSELIAADANWISGKKPQFPLRCKARIRYRQPLQWCTVQASGSGENDAIERATVSSSEAIDRVERCTNVIVQFDSPQRAITPGQSIVFYQNSEMLGGAIIS